MSLAGVNLATTQNGELYNKLTRPEDLNPTTHSPSQDDYQAFETPTNAAKRSRSEIEDHDEDNQGAPSSKKSRAHAKLSNQSASRSSAARPINPIYGMQSMFPGMIDDGGDPNEDDSTTNEALAYLRSVRSEAETIPQLLVAEPASTNDGEIDRSMYSNGRGDQRAVYIDGTWIARDEKSTVGPFDTSASTATHLDPQEQYYKNLLRRFGGLRQRLQTISERQITASKADSSVQFATEVPRNRHGWLYVLDRRYPSPDLLNMLTEHDVLRGLDYCANSLDRYRPITKVQSCWLWSLLAKAPEVGIIDYSIAGRIRNLGHKAGQFGIKLRSGIAQGSQTHTDGEDGEEEWAIDNDGVHDEDAMSSSEDHSVLQNQVTAPSVYSEHEQEKNDASKPPGVCDNTEVLHEHLANSEPGERLEEQYPTEQNGTVPPEHTADAESSVDMSMSEDGEGNRETSAKSAQKDDEVDSEDEGEISEEQDEVTLAQAKARLLAQLGDRLVHQSGSDAVTSSSPTAPARGPRHRHNGKYCYYLVCAPKRLKSRYRAAQQQTGRLQKRPLLLTRAEAEAERQQLLRESAQESCPDMKTNDQLPENQPEMQDQDMASDKTDDLMTTEFVQETVSEVEIPDLNSRVTIDMILTVVAECYGQKDLLRFRDIWD